LQDEICRIRFQIDEAKAYKITTGKYSDPLWFAQANHALRIKGKQHQAIQREMGERRQEKKAEAVAATRTFARVFQESAKAMLTNDVYMAIIHETQVAMQAEGLCESK
jgi:hypothetical protein